MSETTAIETVTTERTLQTEPVNNENEIDEEYRWLTERLDALSTELRLMRELLQTQMTAITQANENALQESRTLIHSLTDMVTSSNQTLTALAASTLLQSTHQNSEITSEPVVEETIVENPESVVEESRAARTEPVEKRRKKL